jgi:hypothetical protein
MQKRKLFAASFALCSVMAFLPAGLAQSLDGGTAAGDAPPAAPADNPSLPKFGIALTAGTLGAGIQIGTAVARHSNVRGGFNYFSYSLSGTRSSDNLAYDGTLRLASAEVLFDQYLAGPFHVSAGALVYDGFQGSGTVHVPGGSTLTLNNTQYYSSAADPVTGSGLLTSRKVAPEILIGFGNLLPRSAHHFTFNLDLGVAFQGSPNAKLNLSGSTCLTPTSGCGTISSQPTVQSNIIAEQNKINNDLAPFKFYPVIRFSFGYKF